MKNIIKYILIFSVCLIFIGCGQDTPDPVVYESPLSKVVDARNTDIINKFNNAVEITVKYDMDKKQTLLLMSLLKTWSIKDILYLVEK